MNANTEQSELIERATIYQVGGFSINRTEIRDAVYYRGDYAQYRDALFIECVVKGKRKRVRFTDSHNKTTVLVRGWDNPEPPSTMVEVQSSSSFTVTTARWASYDPRYKGLFNDWLIEQQDTLDVIVDVREERRSLAEIEAEVNEKTEQQEREWAEEAARRAQRPATKKPVEPEYETYQEHKTIARNRTALLNAIFATAQNVWFYDDGETGNTTGEFVKEWYERLSFAKLRQRGPHNYQVRVHSNNWYEFDAYPENYKAGNEKEETAVTEPSYLENLTNELREFDKILKDKIAEFPILTVEHQGTWTWVKFEEKPAQEVIDALNGNGLGFSWSKKRSAWYAREVVEETTIRQAIAKALGVVKSEGETAVSPSSPSPEPQQPQRQGDPVLAAKLRVYADGLDKAISRKRDTFAGANVTRRRAGMIAQANKEADALQRVQQILRALADLHDAGDVPDYLSEVKHKKTAITLEEDVARLSYNEKIGSTANLWGYGDVERYFAGYDAYLQAVKWAQGVIDGNHDPEAAQRNKLRQMVNEAKLAGIPGYFATPEAVQDDYLFRELDLQPGDLVLEPSAGDGRLADGLVKRFPGIKLHCGEISHTLRKILQVKGYELVSDDFLEYAPGEIYDAIVMNPPFENQADIDHIRHAFTLLKPGGTLVSVTSRGWTFRSDKKATAFREFVDEHGWGADLPDGSFEGEGTGAATSYVVLTK